jgi:eukaryotic-like serine/threonine-protein kinase
MGTSQGSAPNSIFRIVALVTSTVATILFVLCAAAIARYGDRIRDFGWTPGRPNGVLVVARVDPGGPANALLQAGDAIVAWNSDPRIARVGIMPFRRTLPPNVGYNLTIERAGVERTVTLTVPPRQNDEQWRLSVSNLLAAFVWFLLATMIALFRPELTVSRSAYAAGMVMGFFMLGRALGMAPVWLPSWWRNAVIMVFLVSPLHLAIGYDFYVRFPPGVSATQLWQGIRIALYIVCGTLFVFGSLIDTVMYTVAPGRVVAVRDALVPVDRLLQWPAELVLPLSGLAMVAVMLRNYAAVQREDDRRRLRWVLWGTILGLTPFLAFQLTGLAMRIAGTPINVTRWNPPVNLATVLIPISFGYAIIKHHVFDITFVVRRGLQYLLAKNALRFLLALPIAGLAYGILVHRDQPIGQLLWTNSPYLYLIGAAILSLRFRRQLTRWLDRRFFREASDRQRILVELIDNLEKLESASSVGKLVSHELEAVFHPTSLFVWYREGDKTNLTLSYSSGGYIHAVELSPASALLQLAERTGSIIELPLPEPDTVPRSERDWLDDAGVRLIVPMIGSERQLVGLLMLGDKKSDEPYSTEDLKLLQAIARQIAVARDNVRLKERVDRDRRVRYDVLAHLETGHFNVLKECPTCGVCYDAASAVCASDGTELTLSLPVERTINGKYRLDRLIGRGGMGAVYEAADLRLARSVAVKIMRGRSFGDRQALRRFEREAQTCAQLTHPNIITVFDFGAVGADGAFLVMELVQGRTLRDELDRRGHLPSRLAAMWFEQICEGVAAAHHRHVVHRDLKPENVVIAATSTGSEIVKVLDFGLAKMRTASEETGGLTHPGIVLGTAGYMAPEQLTAGEVDYRADIFAIGVMVTEAIVGERPFRGRGPTELLMSIANDSLTLGGEGAERRRLEAVLRRATATDPVQRYASVAALVRDLIPALHAVPTVVGDPNTQTTLPS